MSQALPQIYLARHGETAWTITGQHTGRTDIPLTARGERNARSLAGRLQGVTFATNSADLIPQANVILDNAVSQLKGYPALVIQVRGYTDNRGSAAYNQDLSQRRAESVMQYLRQHGVTNSMTAKGYGKEDPIADNSTKDGQLTNRRVTLHIENAP